MGKVWGKYRKAAMGYKHRFVTGRAKHDHTGAHVVWLSLTGTDVRQIAAFVTDAEAALAQTETQDALVDLWRTSNDGPLETANKRAFAQFGAFLDHLEAVSTARSALFSAAQLQTIVAVIEETRRQQQQAPAPPEDFARVLLFDPDALRGEAMPRVRLVPLQQPDTGKAGSKGKYATLEHKKRARGHKGTTRPAQTSARQTRRVSDGFADFAGFAGFASIGAFLRLMRRLKRFRRR